MAEPWFGSPKLIVRGRDRTSLVGGLSKQVEAVCSVLAVRGFSAEDVPVLGAFCFVQGELPMLRTLTIGGFPLLTVGRFRVESTRVDCSAWTRSPR